MPRADKIDDSDFLLRTMCFGPTKAKKTWWGLLWAECGYNVLHLDGDDGWHIMKQMNLSAAAKKRIYTVRLPTIEDRPVFSRFMAQFLSPGQAFFWDETARQATSPVVANPEHAHYYFDPSKLTKNDVILADSWTSLVDSCFQQYARENDIDLSEAKDSEDKFGGLRFQQNFLNWVLMRMHALPCHVIVIAHSYTWEKWDRRDKRNPKLVKQVTLPISSSGPHAEKLGKHFSDILHFTRLGSTTFYVDAGGDADRDSGSRLFPPEKVNWDTFTPDKLCAKLGWKGQAGDELPAALWFPPGTDLKQALKDRQPVAEKPKSLLATANAQPGTVEKPKQPTIGSTGGILGRLNIGNNGG